MGYKFLIVSFLFLSSTLQIKAQSDYSNLEFVENKGQWDTSQHFRAQFPTGTFYIQKHGFRVLMHNPEELQAIEEQRHGHELASSTETTTKTSSAKKPLIQRGNGAPNILHSHIYQVSFLNDNEQAEFIPDKPLPTYNNYFIGNDRTKWASGCKVYQGITYKSRSRQDRDEIRRVG